MKIATLELIHKLLEEEKNKQLRALQKARKNLNEAIDEDKEEDILAFHREIKNNCDENYNRAFYALQDFEQNEW